MIGWCFFVVTFVVRFLTGCLAYAVWVMTWHLGCEYFKWWKSYDILWFWAHLFLSAWFVQLRKQNYFVVFWWMLWRKLRTAKSLNQIYKEEILGIEPKEKKKGGRCGRCLPRFKRKPSPEVELEKVENGENENEKPGDPKTDQPQVEVVEPPEATSVGCCGTSTKPAVQVDPGCCARKLERTADAVDVALFLYRMRVSMAILLGSFYRMATKVIIQGGDKEELLYDVFKITLWIDIGMLYVTGIWAWCQQCRLCCKLGLCRFIKWALLTVFFGAITMEMPMMYIHSLLNYSWCEFLPQTAKESVITANMTGEN